MTEYARQESNLQPGISSSIDERLPAQVWDLTAMRRELARRGIELPADVLSPAATVSAIEGELEVVLDDGGLLRQLDAGTQKAAP